MKFCLLYVINVKYLTFYNVRYTIWAYDIGTKCMNNGCSEPEPCLRGLCASWLLSDYASCVPHEERWGRQNAHVQNAACFSTKDIKWENTDVCAYTLNTMMTR